MVDIKKEQSSASFLPTRLSLSEMDMALGDVHPDMIYFIGLQLCRRAHSSCACFASTKHPHFVGLRSDPKAMWSLGHFLQFRHDAVGV